jgi:hypothetical protein
LPVLARVGTRKARSLANIVDPSERFGWFYAEPPMIFADPTPPPAGIHHAAL